MKTVISGRLIKKPELKRVVLKDGREEVVCDYSLWVSDAAAPVRTGSDGKPHKADIPFSCTAWGDNAREIAEKGAGDVLTGSYIMRYSEIRPAGIEKPIVSPVYVIRRIDPENKIQKQLSELLTGYETGKFDDVSRQDPQPDFGEREIADPQPEKESNLEMEPEADV